jgi:hypothetical protein
VFKVQKMDKLLWKMENVVDGELQAARQNVKRFNSLN